MQFFVDAFFMAAGVFALSVIPFRLMQRIAR